MTLYRYNAKKREHRKFNTTDREKNPLNVQFYSKTLEYANEYKFARDEEGNCYECELVTTELGQDVKLFNMNENFKSLNTFVEYCKWCVSVMVEGFEFQLRIATTAKKRKHYTKMIEEFSDLEKEMERNARSLPFEQFQFLSDGEWQLMLAPELKSMGFDGYETEKEVAIF